MSTKTEVSYTSRTEIARGGMGVVLQAQDAKLGRAVAMKVMLRARATEEERWRFVQEARVLGQLAHPNIVPVHDLGVDEQGRPFYTMKLVQGHTLQAILDQLKAGDATTLACYPLRQLLTIFQKACDAVAFAHSRGIIHRDLKPQNLMVGEFGEVLVMDWGLAKILPGSPAAATAGSAADWPAPQATKTAPTASETAATQSAETETLAAGVTPAAPEPKLAFNPLVGSSPALPSPSQQLTLEGRVLGTPHYMSPEQAEGKINELDERTDVFALGGILYALLTLRPPVDGASVEEMLARARQADITPPSALNARSGSIHLHQRPTGGPVAPRAVVPLPHLAGGRVPAALSAVAMKALAPAPANRYPDVTALAADISAFQAGFATNAENAGALTLFRLFLHRHKALAAAASLLAVLTVGFMLRLMVSEQAARHQADLAQAQTIQSAQSLASARIGLADAAYREQDANMMRMHLNAVPKEHRTATWKYLVDRADSSTARISAPGGGAVHCVVAHPTKSGVFIVADANRRVTMVNPATGQQLSQFTHTLATNLSAPEFRIAVDPAGERVAVVAGGTTNATVHRLADGELLHTVPSPGAYRVEFSRDGQRLFLHRSPGPASMVDLATGRELWRSSERLRWALLADDQRVFGASFLGAQHLLDARDGKPLASPQNTRQDITAVAASPTENLVYVGFENGVIRGVIPDGFKLRFESHAGAGPVEFFATTPDGQWLVSLAADPESGRQALELWETTQGQRMRSFLGGGGSARSLVIHPLSREIALGGTESRVWPLPRHDPQWRLTRCFLPEPQGVFWGSDDVLFTQVGKEPMKLKNLATGEVLWEAPDAVSRMATVSADHRFAYVCGTDAGARGFWLTNSARPQVLAEVPSVSRKHSGVALSPDGNRVALVRERQMVVRQLTTGQERSYRMTNAPELGNPVWLSPERLVFSGTTRNTGAAQSRHLLGVCLPALTNQYSTRPLGVPVLALAVEPNGGRLAEAGLNPLIRLFHTGALNPINSFRAHDRDITALAWHPKLPLLASASSDLSIRLWNADTGELLEEFIGPAGKPIALHFSPSGRRLACAARDRTVHIWDLQPSSLSPATSVHAAPTSETNGWRDLMRELDPHQVKLTGNGWVLNPDGLTSPVGVSVGTTVPLPGSFAGRDYRLRVTFRRLFENDGLAILLPVGNRRTAFFFDGWPHRGLMSGFDMDRPGDVTAAQPETIHGRRMTNSEPHQLDFLVRSAPADARITVRLDGQPFIEWRGKPDDLSISKQWKPIPPGAIGFGTHRGGWAVSEAKARALKPGQ